MANLIFGTTSADVNTDGLTYASTATLLLTNDVFASYRSTADINDIIFAGNGDDVFNGLTGNDVLFGESGDDTISGDAGDDLLDGGSTGETNGDRMYGGAGNDVYFVSSKLDSIDETSDAEGSGFVDAGGIDTVVSSVTTTSLSTGYLLPAYIATSGGVGKVENLVLAEVTDVTKGVGNDLSNRLIGNSLGDSLTGNGGDDYLDGRAGIDAMNGGTGNDTYVVDNSSDTITDTAGSADVVYVTGNSTPYIYTLTMPSGTGGTGATPAAIAASAAAQAIEKATVSLGTTTASISASTYTTAITLTGNSGINTLTGGSGNDSLDGGSAGADTLIGGSGNDVYTVANSRASITELTGGGTDIVNVALSSGTTYTITDNIEFARITNTASVNITAGTTAVAMTGNSAQNVLTGGAGNDTLDGSTGLDTMVGKAGNDIYYVDSASDTVTEITGEGTDTVNVGITAAGSLYTLGDFIENATITSIAAINVIGGSADNLLIGNSAANSLDGGTGNDTLIGGPGTDSLTGNDGTDTVSFAGTTTAVTLTLADTTGNGTATGGSTDIITGFENIIGGSAGDILTGNTSANVLTGGFGGDTMTGGATGADVFVIGNTDSSLITSTADVITDFATTLDKLKMGVAGDATANTGNYVASATTAGAASFSAALIAANVALATLNGTSSATELYSFQFDATNGYLFDDTNSDGIANQVVILRGITSSTIVASDLVSNTAITGSATTASDILKGDDGNDTITGGAGADVMTGGGGADNFLFTTTSTSTPSITNFDTITDFSKVAGVTFDTISATALILGTQTAGAASGVATITTGVATFNGADTTFAQHLAAVAAAQQTTAGATTIWQEGSDSYLYISDGTLAVGATDVLIKLVGLTDGALTVAANAITAIA